MLYAEDFCGLTCNATGGTGGAGGSASSICDDPCVSHSGSPMQKDCDECSTLVCASDSFCCKTSWDSICASEAKDLCTKCGGGTGGSGGSAGSGGSTGGPICADACVSHAEPMKYSCSSCSTTVCNTDDYCCDVKWDGFCASRAQKSCTTGCGAGGSAGAAGAGGAGGASGGGAAGASGGGAAGEAGTSGAGGVGGEAGAAGAAGAGGDVSFSTFSVGFSACLDVEKFDTTASACVACTDVSCDKEWFDDGARECSVANSAACNAACTSSSCYCHCMMVAPACGEKLKSFYSCMSKACGSDCK